MRNKQKPEYTKYSSWRQMILTPPLAATPIYLIVSAVERPPILILLDWFNLTQFYAHVINKHCN